MKKIMNVAIDGPAGAGKSTIARRAAKELGYIYVDTGAMYRGMAYHMLKKGIDLKDEAAVSAEAEKLSVSISYENGEQAVLVNGENVTPFIRTPEVSAAASTVSAYPKVRAALLNLQKDLAKKQSVLMDGRDIGTVVLPQADVKIFLTASAEIRGKRRYDELIAKGQTADLDQIIEDVKKRDEQDMNRAIAPLRQAEDAILVDSSHMSIEEVTDRIVSLVKAEEERGK
ncbi:MAG: (d)CMP kinase [Lachnospiraceae bacterium]|nr:(d)CMP kinase [Lachnospiraceae bacterium]